MSVLVDLEDLSAGDGGCLEDGSPLGARLFDLITCTAIISVILGTNRNNVFVPLALARGRRGASHAQWQALVARDRGCIRCARPARCCQAHHIIHWRHAGKTTRTIWRCCAADATPTCTSASSPRRCSRSRSVTATPPRCQCTCARGRIRRACRAVPSSTSPACAHGPSRSSWWPRSTRCLPATAMRRRRHEPARCAAAPTVCSSRR